MWEEASRDCGRGIGLQAAHCTYNPPMRRRPAAQVGVRVEEEDARTGARHHCCSAYLTFVALARKDPAGGPSAKVELPKVLPADRHQATIHAEAARR